MSVGSGSAPLGLGRRTPSAVSPPGVAGITRAARSFVDAIPHGAEGDRFPGTGKRWRLLELRVPSAPSTGTRRGMWAPTELVESSRRPAERPGGGNTVIGCILDCKPDTTATNSGRDASGGSPSAASVTHRAPRRRTTDGWLAPSVDEHGRGSCGLLTTGDWKRLACQPSERVVVGRSGNVAPSRPCLRGSRLAVGSRGAAD